MTCERRAHAYISLAFPAGLLYTVRMTKLFSFLMTAFLCAAPAVLAQSADLAGTSGDMVRVVRHPDGTRSVYQRQVGWKGMRCATYTSSGKLAAVNDYTEGKYGQLVSCIIYDDKKKNIIYKVAYGYDSRARLVEERMYNHPAGKLVQRVIYKYDRNGERSKPVIISLNTGGGAVTQEIAPTMKDDVNAINKEMRDRGQRR